MSDGKRDGADMSGIDEQAYIDAGCPARPTSPPDDGRTAETIGRDVRQTRAYAFVHKTFGAATTTPLERALRFFEEASELAQAAGVAEEQARGILRHVFGKPAGEPRQEVGGVGVTLLAYCEAAGFSADDAEKAELDRVIAIDPDYFRQRHNAKVTAGISTAMAPCNSNPGVLVAAEPGLNAPRLVMGYGDPSEHSPICECTPCFYLRKEARERGEPRPDVEVVPWLPGIREPRNDEPELVMMYGGVTIRARLTYVHHLVSLFRADPESSFVSSDYVTSKALQFIEQRMWNDIEITTALIRWGESVADFVNEPRCNCNPLERTGGDHHHTCPAWEPECTCYEMIGGHQPGCYFNRRGSP